MYETILTSFDVCEITKRPVIGLFAPAHQVLLCLGNCELHWTNPGWAAIMGTITEWLKTRFTNMVNGSSQYDERVTCYACKEVRK